MILKINWILNFDFFLYFKELSIKDIIVMCMSIDIKNYFVKV